MYLKKHPIFSLLIVNVYNMVEISHMCHHNLTANTRHNQKLQKTLPLLMRSGSLSILSDNNNVVSCPASQ